MTEKQSSEVSHLNRLCGQLGCIQKMLDDKEPLDKVLQQIEAVRGSLKSFEKKLIEQRIETIEDSELKRSLDYLLKIS